MMKKKPYPGQEASVKKKRDPKQKSAVKRKPDPGKESVIKKKPDPEKKVSAKKKSQPEKDLSVKKKPYAEMGRKKTAGKDQTLSGTGCPYEKKCGGCCYQNLSYEAQLKIKQSRMVHLLGKYGKVSPIIGMENPRHYRYKVHAVFGRDKKGNIISGTYESSSHRLVKVEHCLIEEEKSQEIIAFVRKLCKDFKLTVYDEDLGTGLLRHIMIRRGFATGEIMVILVTASSVFPGRTHFVKALTEKFPEITTIVQNINSRHTSLILGDREQILMGKGYIHDEICGNVFRISSGSFYQVNPVQTEKLYRRAIKMAGMTGRETVLDAYCGTGTIGMCAAAGAGRVIGVELNKAAVRDAFDNIRENHISNMTVYQGDAGLFMQQMAAKGEKTDVVFMDPPRSGADRNFLTALLKTAPEKIVYISCGPDTLTRDVGILVKGGYRVKAIQPVDLFPYTEHVETVVLLSKVQN